MFLSFYELVWDDYEQSCLQFAVFLCSCVDVVGFVLVDGVDLFQKQKYFSHDKIALFHDFAHVEFVLFVLFSLFGQVGVVQTEEGVGACVYVDFPAFVGDLFRQEITQMTLPTTMSPVWGWYRFLMALTMMSLLVISTVPRSELQILLSTLYVP